MKKTIVQLLGAAILTAGTLSPGLAATPKNALGAIAVSPDGATVLAAGDNRVLYVVDANDLTVRRSVWIEINPLSIFFTSDGSRFVIHDTTGGLRFFDAATYEQLSRATDANAVAFAEGADILFAAASPKGRVEEASTALRGYDARTGRQILDTSVKGSILSIGTPADGSRIVALTRDYDTDTEQKERAPKDLKGLDKLLFEQRHDAKAAEVITLKPDGSEASRTETWFSSSMDIDLVDLGSTVLAVGYRNINAELGSGEPKLFQLENSFNYGIGHSAKHGAMMTGGLANGSMTYLKEGVSKTFKIDKIDGWPEYFKGFAVSADGTAFGGTTAYRLVKIGPDGAVIKVAPVF